MDNLRRPFIILCVTCAYSQYDKSKLTRISLDTKVEEDTFDEEQDVRQRQADQGGIHLPTEAKNLICELCIHRNFQQDVKVDEQVVSANRSKQYKKNVNLVLSSLTDIFVCFAVKCMQGIRCPLEMIDNILRTHL